MAIDAIAAVLFMVAVFWTKVPSTSLLPWASMVIGLEIFGLYHHFEYKTFKRLRANAPIEITETLPIQSLDFAVAGASLRPTHFF